MAAAPLKRVLYPHLNPAGLMAGAGAVYAAAVMIVNAYHHHGVISVPVVVAAVAAVAALLTRQVVTPVADPKDGNGNALVPVAPVIPWTGPVSKEYEAALRAALANITPGAKPQADVSPSADPPMDHLAPPVT
jgi:hypothetical protein